MKNFGYLEYMCMMAKDACQYNLAIRESDYTKSGFYSGRLSGMAYMIAKTTDWEIDIKIVRDDCNWIDGFRYKDCFYPLRDILELMEE